MSDHEDLADRREQEADALERDSERVGESADAAREALEDAQGDELIPAAMGDEDPARRDSERIPSPGDPSDETPPSEEEEDPARPRA